MPNKTKHMYAQAHTHMYTFVYEENLLQNSDTQRSE